MEWTLSWLEIDGAFVTIAILFGMAVLLYNEFFADRGGKDK
jgi:hypothetical protein